MKNLFESIKSNVVHFGNEEQRIARSERRRAIAELRALSNSQLRDIGITRGNIIDSVKHGRDIDRAA